MNSNRLAGRFALWCAQLGWSFANDAAWRSCNKCRGVAASTTFPAVKKAQSEPPPLHPKPYLQRAADRAALGAARAGDLADGVEGLP